MFQKSQIKYFKGFNILSAFFVITILLACIGITDDPVPIDDPIEVDEDDSNSSDAKLEIILNNDISLVYENVSLDKWPFENYYKA